MNDNIKLGAGDKGPVCPDEKTIAREVARNGTVLLAIGNKFGFKPAEEALMPPPSLQKGSSIRINSSLFCPVETIEAFTPMSASMRLI